MGESVKPKYKDSKSQTRLRLVFYIISILVVGSGVFALFKLYLVPHYKFMSAREALSKTDSYAVSTTMEVPDGTATYVEVTTPDGNYSEYPYAGGSANSTDNSKKGDTYMLHDWLTKDNKLYQLNTSFKSEDDKSTMWISMPDEYAKSVGDRKTLYINELSPYVHNFSSKGTESMNLGEGDKDVSLYTCEVSDTGIKNILKKDSYDLYNAILTEGKKKKDKNVTDWLDTKLKTLDRNLTVSDGELTYGIYDGKLVYMRLEFGGLGSQMVITKHVILSNYQKRELPDFSSISKTYYDTVKSYADAVAKYGGEDEANKAINSQSSDGQASTKDASKSTDTSKDASKQADTSKQSSSGAEDSADSKSSQQSAK